MSSFNFSENLNNRIAATSADLVTHLKQETSKLTEDLLKDAEVMAEFAYNDAAEAGRAFVERYVPAVDSAVSLALDNGAVVSLKRISNEIKAITKNGEKVVGTISNGVATFVEQTSAGFPKVPTMNDVKIDFEAIGRGIADQAKITDLMDKLCTLTHEGRWDLTMVQAKLAPYITELDGRGKALYDSVIESMISTTEEMQGQTLLQAFRKFYQPGLESSHKANSSDLDWNNNDYDVSSSFTIPVGKIIESIGGAMAVLGGPISKIIGVVVYGVSKVADKVTEVINNKMGTDIILNDKYDAPIYAQPILQHTTKFYGHKTAYQQLDAVGGCGKEYNPYGVTYFWSNNTDATKLNFESYVSLNFIPKFIIDGEEDGTFHVNNDIMSIHDDEVTTSQGDFNYKKLIMKCPKWNYPDTSILKGMGVEDIKQWEADNCETLNTIDPIVLKNLSKKQWMQILAYNTMMFLRTCIYQEGGHCANKPVSLDFKGREFSDSIPLEERSKVIISSAINHILLDCYQLLTDQNYYDSVEDDMVRGNIWNYWNREFRIISDYYLSYESETADEFRLYVLTCDQVGSTSHIRYVTPTKANCIFEPLTGQPAWSEVADEWEVMPVPGVRAKGNAMLYPPRFERSAWIMAGVLSAVTIVVVLGFVAAHKYNARRVRKQMIVDKDQIDKNKRAYIDNPNKETWKVYKKSVKSYNRKAKWYGGSTLNLMQPQMAQQVITEYTNTGISELAGALNKFETPGQEDKMPITIDDIAKMIKG